MAQRLFLKNLGIICLLVWMINIVILFYHTQIFTEKEILNRNPKLLGQIDKLQISTVQSVDTQTEERTVKARLNSLQKLKSVKTRLNSLQKLKSVKTRLKSLQKLKSVKTRLKSLQKLKNDRLHERIKIRNSFTGKATNRPNSLNKKQSILQEISKIIKNKRNKKGNARNVGISETTEQITMTSELDNVVKMAPLSAPGEMGKPVKININELKPEERARYRAGMNQHGFSVYTSDMISLRRRIGDRRHELCKTANYSTNLPDTSVIICFHNEAWSVLLRTVFSVLDRSPPRLITEIILVDDFSDHGELKKPLEEFLQKLKKVKILRTKKREGLTRARLLGVSVAKGTVLTFLDSHCECYPGWLEPLLARIAEDPTRVVCPRIDGIRSPDFVPGFANWTHIGVFDITRMTFRWKEISEREKAKRTSPIEPYRTPVIAGGLFSISRDYFIRMGSYDPGMEIWGLENLEISLRIWMCGGSMEILPCSRIGHIFRISSPYSWPRSAKSILRKNAVRVAEVWLDDYKQHYYSSLGNDLGEYGDVSDRKALRRRLECNTFDWYVKNVFPEMSVPPSYPYAGEIENEGVGLCIEAGINARHALPLKTCINDGYERIVKMKESGELYRDKLRCITAVTGQNISVMYKRCAELPEQIWEYTNDHNLKLKGTNMCLDVDMSTKSVRTSPCSRSVNQKWKLNKKIS